MSQRIDMSESAVAPGVDRPLVSRAEFVRQVRAAAMAGTPFAAGKLGPSQLHWVAYPRVRAANLPSIGVKAYEQRMFFHGVKNSGVFPGRPDFYMAYNADYVRHLRNLDSIGLFLHSDSLERAVVREYGLESLTHYQNHEPDRSIPDRADECYLPSFRDRRILIVCPFAQLLRDRATAGVFEAVWAKTGKRWFDPAAVDALEFPYGVAAATRERYATVFDLIDEVTAEIARRDFDVALIGAAGMAIPIASFIKDMGKVAIDLGGHLQMLFGVIGKRWRDQSEWRERYFTEAWIDMPARYRPAETDVCDRGAYW